MKSLFNVLAVLLTVLFCSTVFATDVMLQWIPNSEPDLAGYKLFVKRVPADYDFTKPTWQGPEVTTQVLGLANDGDYFFVLRAYDVWGNESTNSNEVRLYRGQIPDTVPPEAPALETITITVGP